MSPNRITYAVGDLHGRFDLLQRFVAEIKAHLDGRVGHVVFLGDYVDRGPDGRQVLDFLMRSSRHGSISCLKGNHEDMMLRAFSEGRQAALRWIGKGGDTTLRSYEASGVYDASLDLVDPKHLAWLKSLPTMKEDRFRVFVHAGLTPDRPLTEQGPDVAMWIRKPFLEASSGRFLTAKHIVHGHTPVWTGKRDMAAPELRSHRTNLDSGAYKTGVLSVGVFDADRAGGPIEVMQITMKSVSSVPLVFKAAA